jgi:ABC-type Mn2+/Zn2+ transport system permease subunit
VVVLSVLIAVFSAAAGYYLSWTLSLPTGPVMVALSASFWILGGLKRLTERT